MSTSAYLLHSNSLFIEPFIIWAWPTTICRSALEEVHVSACHLQYVENGTVTCSVQPDLSSNECSLTLGPSGQVGSRQVERNVDRDREHGIFTRI